MDQTVIETILKFLDSPGYQYLYTQLREKYVKEWEMAGTEEYEKREIAHSKLSTLRDFDKEIRIFTASLKLR